MNIDYTSHFDNDEEIKEFFTPIEETEEIEHEVETDTVETEEVEEEKTLMGVVAHTKEVYVRSKPSKESDPVTTVKEGKDVLITGVSEITPGDSWYAVTTETGKDGYIMSSYVDIVD